MATVELVLTQGLREVCQGASVLTMDADSVPDALEWLARDHPQARGRIFRVDGRIRESISLFVNGTEFDRTGVAERPLRDGDRIELVSAIAGGRAAAAASAPAALSPEDIRRYSRQLLLPEVGRDGQHRLAGSKVLIVGAGGLGAPAALYLAGAGVGTIGLVDFDRVDLSNLPRQVLYATEDVGQSKVAAAARRLNAVNPRVTIIPHEEPLTAATALERIEPYDVVLDTSDNFATRYLVNDACALLGKPDVFGSVYRFEGQLSVFDAQRGPCYRCLFPEPPPPGSTPSCAEGGVLGVVPGIVGELQATEALKLLLGLGTPLIGRLLLYDALELRFHELEIARSPTCALCGPHPTVTALIDYPRFCGEPAPGTSAEIQGVEGLDPRSLAAALDSSDPPFVIDIRHPSEWAIGVLPKAHRIPREELSHHLAEFGRAREVILVCAAGRRSAQAVSDLRALGVGRVRHLEGGLDAWIMSGRPLDEVA